MKLAADDTRKSMGLAISSGVPARPIALELAATSSASRPMAVMARTKPSDLTNPTHTQLTRTPLFPYSAAIVRVRLFTPAFAIP